jgi:hypothetical protein
VYRYVSSDSMQDWLKPSGTLCWQSCASRMPEPMRALKCAARPAGTHNQTSIQADVLRVLQQERALVVNHTAGCCIAN